MPLTESQTRYVNFYTDFAFKTDVELAKYTPEERQDYEESLKNFRDWYSVMKTEFKKGRREGHKEGLEEGMEKGRKEGMEKGRDERSLEIAHNLKNMGLPVENIIAATGLTAEDINTL